MLWITVATSMSAVIATTGALSASLLAEATQASSSQGSILPMIYLICTIVGGGMILLSTFLGGDSGADALDGIDAVSSFDLGSPGELVHAGDGAGFGHGAHSPFAISAWFSFRFLLFFVAVFGAIGLIFTYTSTMSWGMTLLAASFSGAAIGQIAHQTIRYIANTGGDGSTHPEEYLHIPGRVTVAVQSTGLGEISIHLRGMERFIPCRAKNNNDRFAIGEQVVIVAYENGTAEVISKKEYDFVTDGKRHTSQS